MRAAFFDIVPELERAIGAGRRLPRLAAPDCMGFERCVCVADVMQVVGFHS